MLVAANVIDVSAREILLEGPSWNEILLNSLNSVTRELYAQKILRLLSCNFMWK